MNSARDDSRCLFRLTYVQSKAFNPILILLFLFSAVNQSLGAQDRGPRKPILVGYFGQWGLYSDPQYTLKDLTADDKAARLDQLNYAQAFVTGGRCSIADRNADLDHVFDANSSVSGKPDDPSSAFRGHFHQLAELRRAHPRLKVLISLEGRAPDFAFDAQPENRSAFVASCIDLFLKGNLAPGISAPGLFDGIDLDWEYPHEVDAANFIALLTEFRRQLDALRPGLKLSVAVGPSPRMYQGTDFRAVAAQVDEIGLMTYDFAGPWMQTTGFIAPLYEVPPPVDGTVDGGAVLDSSPTKAAGSSPERAPAPVPSPIGVNPTASTTRSAAAAVAAHSVAPRPPPAGGVAGSVESFLAVGVPASKLLVGVPFYGYGWTQVPEIGNGVYQEGTPVRGDRPYSYIQSLIAGSRIYRDAPSQTPWLFDGDALWTFDDPVSVQAKGAYAVEHNLGGLMIWELSEDTAQGKLLSAAQQSLTGSSPTTSTH